MDIDRKNKKLGIIRSLSSKQWNVDVDFVEILFFIKLIEEIPIKKNYVFWLYCPIIFIAIWVLGNV